MPRVLDPSTAPHLQRNARIHTGTERQVKALHDTTNIVDRGVTQSVANRHVLYVLVL